MMKKVMKQIKSKSVQKIADILLIAGGLNVGLMLANWDLASLVPQYPVVASVLYGFVGTSAIIKLVKKFA